MRRLLCLVAAAFLLSACSTTDLEQFLPPDDNRAPMVEAYYPVEVPDLTAGVYDAGVTDRVLFGLVSYNSGVRLKVIVDHVDASTPGIPSTPTTHGWTIRHVVGATAESIQIGAGDSGPWDVPGVIPDDSTSVLDLAAADPHPPSGGMWSFKIQLVNKADHTDVRKEWIVKGSFP